MVQVSTAILAAAVAVIVAFLTPAVTSLRARRDAVSAKFDTALAALLLVQAARNYPTGMHHTRSDGSVHDNRALDQRLAEQCIEFFVSSTAAAKTALVAIEQYVPEIRGQLLSGWELPEAEEPVLRKMIEDRRAAAVNAERLFRRRRPIAP